MPQESQSEKGAGLNENASIVQATTLVAGNGVVLLRVIDLVKDHELMGNPWVILGMLVLPRRLVLFAAF